MGLKLDFDTYVMLHDVEQPEKEYRFHPERRWRFDRAWPKQKVAVELEGARFGRPITCHCCGQTVKRKLQGSGKWITVREGGRHNTGKGYENDMEKYNAAIELGWVVLRFPPEKVDMRQIKRVLISRSEKVEL